MKMAARDFFFAKATSRKFVLVVGTFATATILLLISKISEAAWSNVVEWVVAGYILGSVAEKTKWVRDDATVSPKSFMHDSEPKTPKQGPEKVEQ